MPGFINTPAYNQRASSSWAIIHLIKYYTQRDLQLIRMTREIYDQNFANKDWKEFSEEQVVIKGDTLYFCIY